MSTMLDKAQTHLQAKQYQKALVYSNKVIGWHPKIAHGKLHEARSITGQIYEGRKDYNKAHTYYVKANDIVRRDALINKMLDKIRLYQQQASYNKALSSCNKVISWHPNIGHGKLMEARTCQGDAYKALGNFSLSYVSYREAGNKLQLRIVQEKIIESCEPAFQRRLNSEYNVLQELYKKWKETKTKSSHTEKIEKTIASLGVELKKVLTAYYISNEGVFTQADNVNLYLQRMDDIEQILYKRLLRKQQFRANNGMLKKLNDELRFILDISNTEKAWLVEELPERNIKKKVSEGMQRLFQPHWTTIIEKGCRDIQEISYNMPGYYYSNHSNIV